MLQPSCRAVISAILVIFVILVVPLAASAGDVYVRGYYRKDGTYVQPHYRSAPDGNPYNNWSFPGGQVRGLLDNWV
jgi:hypothetical protein